MNFQRAGERGRGGEGEEGAVCVFVCVCVCVADCLAEALCVRPVSSFLARFNIR